MLGKSIGIIRNIDEVGRFVVPKEIVNALNWQAKKFAFQINDDKIIISLSKETEDGRKLDGLSRLVVPKWIRNIMGIKGITEVEMYFFESGLSLRVWEGLE